MARFGEINAQYFDDAGDPLGGGKLYFYDTGTTTLKNTYSDINFTIPNPNPVILTAAGRQPNIFFDGVAKAILANSSNVQILVRDPVGETGTNFGDPWIATKIYSTNSVVIGSDGVYYRSLIAGNQNNNPATTSGFWSLLYSVQWNAGITYQEGSVVTYNGEQFQSLTNSNVNNNPSVSAANWVLLSFAWISTATYADNQNAVGSDGVLYTSQQGSNTGNDPTNAANRPAYWVGTSADAATSAAAAATSASNAATSASNAATSASNAATSETNAGNSATAAATSASNAAASATASAATAGAALWVSGRAYNAGDAAISLVNLQTYRAETTTSGTTDPSADSNWTQLGYSLPSQTGNSGKFLTTNGTAESWAAVNTDSTLATLSQTFSANGNATLTLSTAITAGAPVVSVTKEVAQTGVTNNNWDAAAGSYTLENTAYSTTLSFEIVGFNILNAVYSQSFSVASQSTNPQGVAFNTDGTKMFVIDGGAVLYEYTLTTGFDLSTTSYSQDLSVFSQDSNPRDIAFNADGTKMFLAGRSGNAIYEYTLSTGYDISTSSFVDSFSVSSQESEVEGLTFNTDGTKMFIVGAAGDEVNEYDLSTGFDISTASFSQNFSVSSEETQPFGISFNTNGTKMFIVGATGRDVGEYALTTGFDVSTASFVDSFSVSSQSTNPNGIAFNANGTKMFISCSDTDEVYEYTISLDDLLVLGTGSFASTDVGKTINVNDGVLILTATDGSYAETTAPTTTNTAASGEWSMFAVVYDAAADVLEVSGIVTGGFDISTASFVDSFSVVSQEQTPQGIRFNTDGTKMFVIGSQSVSVNEYTLSTGYDVSTATYSQNFSVSAQESSPTGIAFNTNGTKMFIVGANGDEVNEYSLSVGFNVSTASFTTNFSVSAQDTTPQDIAFSTDGTLMFIVGETGDDVNEYALTTGFDVSTASFADSFSISAQEANPKSIAFNTNGTKMFIVGVSGDDVNEYTLSTGFDVSTASYSQNFSVSAQEATPQGLTFSADGSKMFIVGSTGDDVNEYSTNLTESFATGYQPCISGNIDSTYWTDINSLTATNAIGSGNVSYAVSNDGRTEWSVLDNTDGVRDIVKNNAGTWQYNSNATYTSETWVNATTNTEVAALRQAMEGAASFTGYGLASASYDSVSFSVTSQDTSPRDITFNNDGTKMFVTGTAGIDVNEYTLSTGFDLTSTVTFVDSFSFASQDNDIRSVKFSADGTKMFMLGGQGDDVNEYTCTAFDVSTAVFVDSFSVSAQESDPYGLAFSADGTKMFVGGNTGDDINEYSLTTGFDVSTASFVDSFSVSTQDTNPQALTFSADGTKMFFVGGIGKSVHEYNLTAWDVSTAVYSSSFSVVSQATYPYGIAFSADGTKMFIVGQLGSVYQYTSTTASYTNQMDSTTLNAITDANQITLGDDLDFAAILYYASGATVPTYSGTAINYDANILNQGAVLGTDYNFDVPASNKVRITAVGAGNYKVRVV